mgnify:CR=1 FL=1
MFAREFAPVEVAAVLGDEPLGALTTDVVVIKTVRCCWSDPVVIEVVIIFVV